ncbi:prephenate dehydratase [Nanoarchaeota archaeon]
MTLKIGFQGERGAFSEQAIIKHFGKKIDVGNVSEDSEVSAVPHYSFQDVFENLRDGKIDLGVVPIENFMAGSINQTYDLLLEHKVFIIGEIYLRIKFCLIGKEGMKISEVKRVVSHPQGIAQCDEFIRKHKFEAVTTYDTAGSVKEVKENNNEGEAAIAPEIAADIYGMNVIASGIETVKNNTTRFIIISKEEKVVDENCKSSLVFAVKDIPAALYKCLGGFANNNVNLTKLESRPVRGEHGKYLFYLDFEGSKNDESVQNALEELKSFTVFIKFLGTYEKGKE